MMKGENGSLSKKIFDLKFSLRSGSQRVVQDVYIPVNVFKQSCWANMPPELLMDVLIRIKSSESDWPPGKNVIMCAGIRKSWREITKETIKLPEVSSKLTFPISLKQFNYLAASNDDGKFLLAPRKCRNLTGTDYIISLNADYLSKGSYTFVGILRANFLGTKFVVYDTQPPNGGPVGI